MSLYMKCLYVYGYKGVIIANVAVILSCSHLISHRAVVPHLTVVSFDLNAIAPHLAVSGNVKFMQIICICDEYTYGYEMQHVYDDLFIKKHK